MRHRAPVLAVCILIPLALTAPGAGAKELRAATICGADRCVEVAPEDLSIHLVEGEYETSPDEAEPFYRVRLTIGGGGAHETFGRIVLPRAGYAGDATTSDWVGLSDRTAALYRRLTAGLEPFPATVLQAKLSDPAPAGSTTAGEATTERSDDDGGAPAVAGLAAAAILLVGGAIVLRRGSSAA